MNVYQVLLHSKIKLQ